MTFFKMPTATHPSEEIGAVETKTGGPTVQAKTNAAIKVAVLTVSEPAGANVSTSTW